jgi:hypothetical protein
VLGAIDQCNVDMLESSAPQWSAELYLCGLGRRCDDGAILVHGGRHSPAKDSGITIRIRIRYRILNARLAAGAVSGGGVDQADDGWRVVSQFEFQQWVESRHSLRAPERRQCAKGVHRPAS